MDEIYWLSEHLAWDEVNPAAARAETLGRTH